MYLAKGVAIWLRLNGLGVPQLRPDGDGNDRPRKTAMNDRRECVQLHTGPGSLGSIKWVNRYNQ